MSSSKISLLGAARLFLRSPALRSVARQAGVKRIQTTFEFLNRAGAAAGSLSLKAALVVGGLGALVAVIFAVIFLSAATGRSIRDAVTESGWIEKNKPFYILDVSAVPDKHWEFLSVSLIGQKNPIDVEAHYQFTQKIGLTSKDAPLISLSSEERDFLLRHIGTRRQELLTIIQEQGGTRSNPESLAPQTLNFERALLSATLIDPHRISFTDRLIVSWRSFPHPLDPIAYAEKQNDESAKGLFFLALGFTALISPLFALWLLLKARQWALGRLATVAPLLERESERLSLEGSAAKGSGSKSSPRL